MIVRAGRKPFVSTFIKAEGVAYRKAVAAAIRERFGERLRPTAARVSVSVEAVAPDRRERDLSNLLKAFEDALTHCGVWLDDFQVDWVSVERGAVVAPGWLDVELRRIVPREV
ncbi:Crossover junction endodeoxyribonuclease RusA [Symmachiella macrocystis]|uniref:Crossover junction endodeoxyribonuclease RusA n=1 Tax=Symmachiella macrocystis TaxID=2527985 RepID=A0A5C6BN65_9PLAN|nr:Crossover junction endodeoxyribonuclease RusA [Symmachiella macrocystis]